MTEERALIVRPTMPDVMTLGATLAKSGYFQDARDAAQAVVKVLAGQEIGIPAIASMTGIYIVKGRVTLSANVMAAAIKRSGRYTYHVDKLDDSACSITFFEGKVQLGTSTFTADDAKRAGLGGDNWSKYPRNMLFARALSNGAKWYTPDVFAGPVYTPEELGQTIDGETGEVIGPKWTEPVVKAGEEPEPKVEPPTRPPQPPTDGKRAKVKTGQWNAAAAALATDEPYYTDKGQVNYLHMLNAAHKYAGVDEVTGANLPDVIAALRQHAKDMHDLDAIKEPAL